MAVNLTRGTTNFLIPPGTQVVLKVDKPLADGTSRQRGSVAVIQESPADNQYAYALRFADGQTVKAYFRELAIRRKEVEDQLALMDEDLRPWIVYRCQVGSRAFGLATEESDDDVRGIYLPPARRHWSLFKLPEQLELALAGAAQLPAGGRIADLGTAEDGRCLTSKHWDGSSSGRTTRRCS